MSDRAFQTSRDVVIGLADGAIIVSSVVAALQGSGQPADFILKCGAVTTILGAIIFSISRYSSGKEAEKEFYDSGESDSAPDELLQKLGLGEEYKRAADSAIKEDQTLWQKQINTAEATPETAATTNAVAIGISFTAAGALSIAAFFLYEAANALKITIVPVSILLLFCGLFKARLAGRNPLAGSLIQWTTGAAAIVLFYLMGRLLG